jgi:hypothetical protein
MGDEGQIILLSAFVACLCLLGVIACVDAVNGAAYEDGGHLADMDNAGWARDCALRGAAFYGSACPWEGREVAATRFIAEAGSSMDSLSGVLLKRGEVYHFAFNDSLACEYAATHPGNGTVSLGGVLLEPDGGNARILGCAYDVFAYDGYAAYRESRVATFD